MNTIISNSSLNKSNKEYLLCENIENFSHCIKTEKNCTSVNDTSVNNNKVLLLGNVGKDPEIRASQGGMTIASFTLATADRQKDQSGQWTDKTEWHNLVAFGRTAEIVRDYVKKGSQIFVEGKIQSCR